MKTLSQKGKILMVLTCILYALESVIIAVMAYTNGKIIEFATNSDLHKMGGQWLWLSDWHCCAIWKLQLPPTQDLPISLMVK